MSELSELVIGAVQQSGGKLLWDDMLTQLTYRDQQRLLPECRMLEQSGLIKRSVERAADGSMKLYLNSVGA